MIVENVTIRKAGKHGHLFIDGEMLEDYSRLLANVKIYDKELEEEESADESRGSSVEFPISSLVGEVLSAKVERQEDGQLAVVGKIQLIRDFDLNDYMFLANMKGKTSNDNSDIVVEIEKFFGLVMIKRQEAQK